MVGEMYAIDQETGEDDSGEVWAVHAAIAKALRGKLEPFDKYQGPTIELEDATLFLYAEDGAIGRIFDERSNEESLMFPIDDDELAIEAARALMRRIRRKKA